MVADDGGDELDDVLGCGGFVTFCHVGEKYCCRAMWANKLTKKTCTNISLGNNPCLARNVIISFVIFNKTH